MKAVVAANSFAGVAALRLAVEAFAPASVIAVSPSEAARHDWQPAVEPVAAELGVGCLTVDSGSNTELATAIEDADLTLSVLFPHLFPPEVVRSATGPILNVHPSLLPRHRGVAPLIWAIVEGDRTTGVTIHHVDEGVDTGPIVSSRLLPIHPEDTGYALQQKAARLAASLIADVLRSVLSGTGIPSGQPQSGTPSVHRRSDATLNEVRWADPTRRIVDVVRALAPPLPGCHTSHEHARVDVSRAWPSSASVPGDPGTVRWRDDGMHVATGDGAVRLVASIGGSPVGPEAVPERAVLG